MLHTAQNRAFFKEECRSRKKPGGGIWSGILDIEMEQIWERKKESKALVTRSYPHRTLKNKGIIDSGCSRHMTGNKAYLAVLSRH
ncbi:hypothetical protein Tco_0568505 [Tanacetum coccineum]